MLELKKNLATITLWGTWATNVQVVSLACFGLNLHFNLYAKPPNPPKPFLALSLLWNPHHLRPIQVGDDVLGHVPTPFLLPNLVSNHLAIDLLFYHIGGAIAFVPSVGLSVDERTLNCELLLVLLIRKFLS